MKTTGCSWPMGPTMPCCAATSLPPASPGWYTEGLTAGCFGLSGEGWVDPYSLMTLFRKAATAQGAQVVPQQVAAIGVTGGNVTSLTLANGERVTCGHLVNAAGAGAGAIAALAGIELPVGPRKRYVYVLDCPVASEALHGAPLTVDVTGIYFRPEGRHFHLRPLASRA